MLRNRRGPRPDPRVMLQNPRVSEHISSPREWISPDLQHPDPLPAPAPTWMLPISRSEAPNSEILLQILSPMLRKQAPSPFGCVPMLQMSVVSEHPRRARAPRTRDSEHPCGVEERWWQPMLQIPGAHAPGYTLSPLRG